MLIKFVKLSYSSYNLFYYVVNYIGNIIPYRIIIGTKAKVR